MFQCRFWIVAILCSFVGKTFSQDQRFQQPLEGLRPIHEILRDWKHATRITIDVTDAPLKQVMQELERQSGVQFSSFHEDKKLSLKLKDALLWQALAETSIRVDLPIWVFGQKEIRFAEIADFVYKRYRLAGPFHVGVQSTRLTLKDDKEVPGIVIHAESLASEGAMRQPGISEAFLESPTEKPVALKLVNVLGKSSWNRAYFVVPEELLKKKLKLRAKFECEVFLNAQEVIVPAIAGHVAEFKHFGGIKVSVGPIVGDAVAYTVDWDTKLRGGDAKKVADIQKRFIEVFKGKGKPLSDEERSEVEKWMEEMIPQMRLLSALDHQLLDKTEKVIKITAEEKFVFKNITAEIGHIKGIVPAELRILLAERKIIKGVIEFDDVFSNGPPGGTQN